MSPVCGLLAAGLRSLKRLLTLFCTARGNTMQCIFWHRSGQWAVLACQASSGQTIYRLAVSFIVGRICQRQWCQPAKCLGRHRAGVGGGRHGSPVTGGSLAGHRCSCHGSVRARRRLTEGTHCQHDWPRRKAPAARLAGRRQKKQYADRSRAMALGFHQRADARCPHRPSESTCRTAGTERPRPARHSSVAPRQSWGLPGKSHRLGRAVR